MKITKSELRTFIKEEINQLNKINLLKEEDLLTKFYNYFFGIKRGDIITRDNPGRSNEIFLMVEPIKKDNTWIKVFQIGTIGITKRQKYVSLVFNTKRNNIVSIKNNTPNFTSFRKPNADEKRLLKKELSDSRNKRYIDIIKSKTGINIKK